MLLNKLFIISTIDVSSDFDRVNAVIILKKDHPVFKGHFPGNPILPGVCTVQIIGELLENALKKELMLTRASSIKYLGFINPIITPVIQYELVIKPAGAGIIDCNATISAENKVLCSFKGEYTKYRIPNTDY
jgi:3-hydroxyacyl-[acyl-carrier-protein] dehydratase